MYKIITFLTLLCLYSVFAYSQSVISADNVLKRGENFLMAIHYFYNEPVFMDNFGPNVWDFSKISPDDYDTVRVMSPEKTRYGGLFKGANMAVFYGKYRVDYFNVSDSLISKVGLIDDYLDIGAAVVVQFPNPIVEYVLPAKLGAYFSDTITKNLLFYYDYVNPDIDSIRADMIISQTSFFDAEGTIITPFGKYRTLRERKIITKQIKAYKYTMFGWIPAPEYSGNYSKVLFRWFSPETHYLIAEAETNLRGRILSFKYMFWEPLWIEADIKNVNCKGKKTGKITLKLHGGVPDYSFLWSNNWTTKDIYNQPAGTYTVMVTDNKKNVVTETFSITEPQEELKLNPVVKDISCYNAHDGVIQVHPSGGNQPYIVVWSTDTVGYKIENLYPGIYGVIMKDGNNCFITDSFNITNPPSELNVKISRKDVSCKGGSDGSLSALAWGGQPPYAYMWSTNDSSQIITDLNAGDYELYVTDARNCTVHDKVALREPKKQLSAKIKIRQPKCYGKANGSIIVNAVGGTPPYQYQWNTGDTGNSLFGLESGVFSLLITDANGCSLKNDITLLQPEPISVTPVVVKPDKGKSNGSIYIDVSGGTPPYTFKWSNGKETKKIKKLSAGIYSVRVTDKNNCRISFEIPLEEKE